MLRRLREGVSANEFSTSGVLIIFATEGLITPALKLEWGHTLREIGFYEIAV
jgi:hypothetical protein